MHERVGKKLLTKKHTNNFRNLSSLFIDKDNMINGIISNFDQNVKKSRFACDFCGKKDAKYQCSKCNLAVYCGKKCQKHHIEVHTKMCDSLGLKHQVYRDNYFCLFCESLFAPYGSEAEKRAEYCKMCQVHGLGLIRRLNKKDSLYLMNQTETKDGERVLYCM